MKSNFIPNGVAHSVVEKEEANSNAVPESRDSRLESAEAINSEEHVNCHSRVESEEANSNAEPESCDSRVESAEAFNSEEHVNFHSRVESEEANSNAESENSDSRVEIPEALNSKEQDNLVQKMIPSSSPLEGGDEFLIALGGVLPEDVNGGYAYFGEHPVELTKLNTVNLIGIIPAAEHPGIVKVRVYSQSKTFLGEMDFHYIDLMNRVAFKAVQHGIEGVTKLYGLMGKHSIDWWKQSASVKQNSALSGQATDALNDGCEEKPSAEDPLFAYGYEDLMQFFDMMKCLSEESCSQHLANTEKWIQLSRVVCKIYGQLGHGQNLLHGHVALCGESEENYFADAENSSCEPSHFDIVSLSDSKDCGGSINGDGGTHGDELELYSDPRCNTSFVDSTPISHLDVTGQGSECKSLLLVEEVEKKEVGQDPRPTNISACEKVESWLQSVCSANGLPFLSPGGPESLDTVHNDTLTLLNSVESARAMIEGRE
ncbi:uncharacterized protein LOC111332449 [Stylophora pistillata]|uniref:uncharacterized protein LOC111332449 n=1 Tax=Stylophora pistillata TaxID=50429 RepID=UPI000C0535B3|nr:uncharacterized protein LOC111332449 [Stylophora pistillata]